MQYHINPLLSSSSASGKRDRSTSYYTRSSLSSYNQNHNTPFSDQNSCPNINSSSTKRMKSVGTATVSHSVSATSNRRIFGDELSTNNTSIDEFIHRTNIRDGSIASKAETDAGTVISDCGTTEGSVVAQLRGKLKDFEQKNQYHYLKNNVVPSKEDLEKPLRPKVKPSIKDKPGPTPLPKHAADALVRRMVDHSNSATTSSASTPSIFRQRSTPVRLRIKATPSEDVQATNEGYASVAKLSKWLADDPTSTKKVKQLRRGANIIAKSRKFDKVLANAEIEHVIPRNCVTRSKILLQHALSNDDGDHMDTIHDTPNTDGIINATQPTKSSTPDWMKLGTTASLSVSDKKQWLSNAFHNGSNTIGDSNDGNMNGQHARMTPVKVSKARTEIHSSSSRHNDFGNVAKEKWRQRTPTKVPESSSVHHPSEPEMIQPMNEISLQMNQQPESRPLTTTSHYAVTKSIVHDNNHSDSNVVDFHLARDMLVQRSKVNGNEVDVLTAFQRRKARFQQLEKVSIQRRQSTAVPSSTLFKPTWENATSGTTSTITSNSNHGYVKSYKEDIAPKKSFHDLP